MPPIEIGKKYRNVHTGEVCTVIQKIFYNIGYRKDNTPNNTHPHYCHYKRFRKNWIEVQDKIADMGGD